MSTERADWLAFAKTRALRFLDKGDLAMALSSMMSDMGKREDLRIDQFLALAGMREVMNDNADGLRRWIEGFN